MGALFSMNTMKIMSNIMTQITNNIKSSSSTNIIQVIKVITKNVSGDFNLKNVKTHQHSDIILETCLNNFSIENVTNQLQNEISQTLKSLIKGLNIAQISFDYQNINTVLDNCVTLTKNALTECNHIVRQELIVYTENIQGSAHLSDMIFEQSITGMSKCVLNYSSNSNIKQSTDNILNQINENSVEGIELPYLAIFLVMISVTLFLLCYGLKNLLNIKHVFYFFSVICMASGGVLLVRALYNSTNPANQIIYSKRFLNTSNIDLKKMYEIVNYSEKVKKIPQKNEIFEIFNNTLIAYEYGGFLFNIEDKIKSINQISKNDLRFSFQNFSQPSDAIFFSVLNSKYSKSLHYLEYNFNKIIEYKNDNSSKYFFNNNTLLWNYMGTPARIKFFKYKNKEIDCFYNIDILPTVLQYRAPFIFWKDKNIILSTLIIFLGIGILIFSMNFFTAKTLT